MKFQGVIIFLFLLALPLISANGLVLDRDSLEVVKVETVDTFVNLNVKNTLNVKMFNISFQDTLIADKFNLEAGENKTVQFKINSNTEINKNVVIFGYVEQNLGSSNRTEYVQVNYPSGFDKCNLNLVVGDSITWQNNVLGEIKLKNAGTSEDIAIIPEANNYTLRFNYPQNFNYYATRIGSQFSSVCSINVMDTSGFVRNSDYDDSLALKVNVTFEQTSISTTFPTTSYNLTYNQNYEDFFTLRNTGSRTLKNAKISATWITFTKNNFDLAPGDSINIPYTISPQVLETNQTNKTYSSNVKIEGNFPTYNQNLSIYIKYANIGSLTNITQINEDVIKYLLLSYCNSHPEFALCPQNSNSINSSKKIVSMEITEETYKAQIQEEALDRDEKTNALKRIEEVLANHTTRLDTIDQGFQNVSYTVGNLEQDVKNSNAVAIFLGLIFGFAIVLGGIGYLIIKQKGKVNIFKWGKIKSGEKSI